MCLLVTGLLPESWEPVARSLRINGQSTSIRLERVYWDMLDALARKQNRSTANLISAMHARTLERHGEVRNFTSLLRCACLSYSAKQIRPEIAAE